MWYWPNRVLKKEWGSWDDPRARATRSLEGPRWTPAVGVIPATPLKMIACCGLACGMARLGVPGWGG